ncbi:MAG: thioredoxin family protein [Inquilinus sp.]|uniref:thioredoxin family protein n=1 Tax=Inquilinus sp. TaxID=1932117 RepID=UPI003F40AAC0
MDGYPNVTAVDDQTFESEVLSCPVRCLVEFGATEVRSSRDILQILDHLGSQYQGRAKMFYVDIEKYNDLFRRYNILPNTIIRFTEGQPSGELVGIHEYSDYVDLLGLG